MAKNLYILGFMASGKTLYGKKIARALAYEFVDLDELIERKEKKSINQIFTQKGESYFREIEHLVLKESLKLKHHVISLGGGTPCFLDNLELIKSKGISLFLQVPNNILISRLYENSKDRPLIRNKSKEELIFYVENLLTQRLPYYQQADISCDATFLNISLITKIIKPLIKVNL